MALTVNHLFLFKNLITGTKEERGLLSWRKNLVHESESGNKDLEIYDIPFVTKYMKRVKCCSYIPILPTFNKELAVHCGSCKRTKSVKTARSDFTYDNSLAVSEEIRNNGTSVSNYGTVLPSKENEPVSTQM